MSLNTCYVLAKTHGLVITLLVSGHIAFHKPIENILFKNGFVMKGIPGLIIKEILKVRIQIC